MRDDLFTDVSRHLGGPGGILIISEAGFLKKGSASAGVARQYSGTGPGENCQIGLFLTYSAPAGRTLLDLPGDPLHPTPGGSRCRGLRRFQGRKLHALGAECGGTSRVPVVIARHETCPWPPPGLVTVSISAPGPAVIETEVFSLGFGTRCQFAFRQKRDGIPTYKSRQP